MANEIIQDLIFRIDSNTAALKQGLADAKNQISGFNSQVQKIGGLIKGAFAVGAIIGAGKAIYDFTNAIGEANANVRDLTGLMGKELNEVAGSIKATSDVFGIDFNATLEATNTLAKKMGISFSESSDIIQKGITLNDGNAANFLDTIKQFAPQFQELGLSASEIPAILTQIYDSGSDSGNAIGAFAKANQNLRDMNKAAQDALQSIGLNGKEISAQIQNGTLTQFQAIQLISQRLQGFSNQSTEIGNVLADVFGKKGVAAGADFIKSISTMTTSLDEVVSGADAVEKANLRIVQASSQLNAELGAVFGNQSTLVTELKANLYEIALGAFKSIKQAIVGTINYFIDLYNNSILFRAVVQGIVLQFNVMIDVIKLVGKQLYNVFSTAGQLIKSVLTGNIKDIPKILEESLRQSVTNGVEFGQELATDLKNAATGILRRDPIKLITEDEAKTQATVAVKAFQDVIKSNSKLLTPQIAPEPVSAPSISESALFGKDAGVAVDLTETQTQLTESISLLDSFGAAWEQNVGQIATSSIDTLGSALGDLISGQKKDFKGLVQTVLQGIAQMIKGLIAQAVASMIASNAKFGLPGIALATAGVAAITALFAKLVPAFANGGVSSGGVALVGEKGPELVNLPKNSRVIPNSQTRNMLSGSSGLDITISGVFRGEDLYYQISEVNRRRNYTK